MKQNKKIAVLMTCHNRRLQTLECLEALFQSELPSDYSLEVFLVDDGSSDRTEDAVRHDYPQVNVIKGDGSLFWNGGMRVAFKTAMQQGFDYCLWLNDDTMLHSHAISTLLTTVHEFENVNECSTAVVVGSTQDVLSGTVTYGGQLRVSKWRPIKYQLAIPSSVAIPCDTMNGNCVLIPRSVAQVVGNLDEAFVHSIGDIDYGLRVRTSGFQIIVMPGYAGLCSRNSVENTFVDINLSVRERLNRLNGAKGLPLHAWYVFTRRHCGIFWIIFWLWPYLKVVLSRQVQLTNSIEKES